MDLSESSLRKYEHSVHDPISKVLIPVRTPADSRIGQFALSHGLSSHAFDELVTLLEDPEIRGSEVTISSGESFFSAVAEYRERLLLKRPVSGSPLGFSPIVLDGVIEAMRQDMGSFVEAVPGYELDFQNEDASEAFNTLIHTLQNMALVHRSWVDPVHRLLHLRYCVSGSTLPKAPPPSAVAVAIRELAVDYGWGESNASLWALTALLKHLPNLRSLSIGKMTLKHAQSTVTTRALFKTIGTLSNLEVLLFPYWRPHTAVHRMQVYTFLPLCNALSNLKKLSVLWLSHLQSANENPKRLHLDNLRNWQPPMLKTLVINAPLHPNSLPGTFIRWINDHPHAQPSLETLIVSPDRGSDVDPATVLDLGNGPGFSKLKCVYTNRIVYNAILPTAQDVKVLCLSMVGDRLPGRLPPGLKRLHIQTNKGDQLADATIMSLLHQSDTGALETIDLYEVSSREMFDWNGTTRFPLLADFCSGSVELGRCQSGSSEWTEFGEVVKELLP